MSEDRTKPKLPSKFLPHVQRRCALKSSLTPLRIMPHFNTINPTSNPLRDNIANYTKALRFRFRKCSPEYQVPPDAPSIEKKLTFSASLPRTTHRIPNPRLNPVPIRPPLHHNQRIAHSPNRSRTLHLLLHVRSLSPNTPPSTQCRTLHNPPSLSFGGSRSIRGHHICA